MKYYILYREEPDAHPKLGYGVFDTAEAAFAFIPERARLYGTEVKNYSVRCGEDQNAVILTRPPVLPSANPKQLYGDKKLPVHLVPPALVLEASLNMADGGEKYGPYNYRDSKVEAMTYVGAIQRHLFSYLDGEDVDPESKRGATHLGAIAACVAILVDARNNGKLIDNRPAKGSAGDMIRRAAGVVIPPIPKETK